MLFCQLDYPQELGTKTPNGEVITIAQCGCALCAVASVLANNFGLVIDPLALNQDLINLPEHDGFASNGAGDFDLINWTAITRIFPDIEVDFNIPYYNPPNGSSQLAHLDILDARLNSGYSVIVGVSFNHNPAEPTPTHYVEIYRKNADGTYQCRDSMFRGEEADAVFDTRYAVNGMTVAECILQMISYNGTLPQVEVPVTHYKVGDTIKVYQAVPTGASPESIDFSYGNISVGAPARVSGVLMFNGVAYYDIDQTYIGGGTGYARVDAVDAASIEPVVAAPSLADNNIAMALTGDQINEEKAADVPVEAVTPPVVDTPVIPVDPLIEPAATLTPEQKIDVLSKQKTDLAVQLQDFINKYKTDLEHYTGMIALGFVKPEDILKYKQEVEDEATGLKRQLVQVLRRNKAYHIDMADKEEEDATAIEVGMKYEKLYNDVRNDLSSIAKVFKTQPAINSIVSAAERIRSAYEQVIKQLKNKEIKDAATTAQQTVETIHISDFKNSMGLLERLITLKF